MKSPIGSKFDSPAVNILIVDQQSHQDSNSMQTDLQTCSKIYKQAMLQSERRQVTFSSVIKTLKRQSTMQEQRKLKFNLHSPKASNYEKTKSEVGNAE